MHLHVTLSCTISDVSSLVWFLFRHKQSQISRQHDSGHDVFICKNHPPPNAFFFFLTLTPIHPLHTQEREVHTLVLLPPSCHLAALELTPPPNPKFQRFDLLFGGGDAYACVCVSAREEKE